MCPLLAGCWPMWKTACAPKPTLPNSSLTTGKRTLALAAYSRPLSWPSVRSTCPICVVISSTCCRSSPKRYGIVMMVPSKIPGPRNNNAKFGSAAIEPKKSLVAKISAAKRGTAIRNFPCKGTTNEPTSSHPASIFMMRPAKHV